VIFSPLNLIDKAKDKMNHEEENYETQRQISIKDFLLAGKKLSHEDRQLAIKFLNL
jgi:hypothetical protein